MTDIKSRFTSVANREKWAARGASIAAKAKATKAVWFPPNPVETGKKTKNGSTAGKATRSATKKTTGAARKTTGAARKTAGGAKKTARGAKETAGTATKTTLGTRSVTNPMRRKKP